MSNARDKASAGRVQITYDVETNGAMKSQELPFVVGIMGNFAGKTKVKALADREFADVKSLDALMLSMQPSVSYTVDHPRAGKKPIAVNLTFTNMADFSPGKIADQVPAIARLKALRANLRELLNRSSSDSSRELAKMIESAMKDPEILAAAKADLERDRKQAETADGE